MWNPGPNVCSVSTLSTELCPQTKVFFKQLCFSPWGSSSLTTISIFLLYSNTCKNSFHQVTFCIAYAVEPSPTVSPFSRVSMGIFSPQDKWPNCVPPIKMGPSSACRESLFPTLCMWLYLFQKGFYRNCVIKYSLQIWIYSSEVTKKGTELTPTYRWRGKGIERIGLCAVSHSKWQNLVCYLVLWHSPTVFQLMSSASQ